MSTPNRKSESGNYQEIFRDGGEMGALIRAYDWKAHPLGDPAYWPQTLKNNLQLILNSGYPMFIWWSEDFYMFHNDPYLPALGSKHPRALGARAREMWGEIWDQLGVVAERIFQGGEKFYAEDLLVILDRKGFLEETYWTFSYSAIFDDEGNIGGMFCACNEVTHKVLSQRRLKTLKEIADISVERTSLKKISKSICDTLAHNSNDIPFGLLYLLEAESLSARLSGKLGDLNSSMAPEVIAIDDNTSNQISPWPLKKVLHSRQSWMINELPSHSSTGSSAHQAILLPLLKPDNNLLYGFLILGISGMLKYDTDYQNFHDLIVNQVTTTLRQVQAHRKAEKQQATLLNLFEQAPVAIAILRGPDHILEVANAEGATVWGITLNKALGQPLFSIFPEAKGQGFEDLLNHVLHSGEPFVGRELPVTLNRDGHTVTEYFNFVYHPWQEDGQITGVIAVATNISEQVTSRKEIEEKHKQLLAANIELERTVLEKYKLTALLENSVDFIGLATPEGKGVYVNPAGLDMVGLDSTHSVSALAATDFFFEKDIPFVRQTILPSLLKDGVWEGEFHFRHFQTGHALPILCKCFSVKDPATNELIGLATLAIDITERKKKEAELQQFQDRLALTNEELAATNEELVVANDDLIDANHQLTQVNADLDNFVYMASHDLKTPIDNIEGLLQMLQRYLPPVNAQNSMLPRLMDMMYTSVDRFKSTLTDLAQIARLQRETADDVSHISIAKLLREVQLDLAPMIEEARAQLDIDVSACPQIRFSAKNMRSIVYNLLSNAIKYRSPERPLTVKIRCTKTMEYLVLTVADNGLGIDMANEQKLFSMFQRLHDHVEGTGLGLYIIKKIIENAGGEIKVESQLGEGTTFKVYFMY